MDFLKSGMGSLVDLAKRQQNAARLGDMGVTRIRAARLVALNSPIMVPKKGLLDADGKEIKSDEMVQAGWKPKKVIVERLDADLAYLGDISIWAGEIGISVPTPKSVLSTGVITCDEGLTCPELVLNEAEGDDLIILPTLGVLALEAFDSGLQVIPVSPSFTGDAGGLSLCHVRRVVK